MAEEEKPKQLVQMSTVFASGITAIIAALFTSRLGVAGTLIGTALTPMLMTIGVAVLNAQIEKATNKISDLPSTVRGRISTTQRVRVPGSPSPEEPPKEQEPPEAPSRRRDRRTPGVMDRLRSIPTFLKEMSPSARRRTLLTGAAAGLVAAVIGLAGVTGIEAASGGTLSCTLYEECAGNASGEETAEVGTSLTRVLGSSGGTDTETPSSGGEQPSGVQEQQQDAQPAAPDPSASPQNEQYDGGSQNGGQQTPPVDSQEEPPAVPSQQDQPAAGQEPQAPLQDDGSQQQQPAAPGVEQQQATPPEQQQQ